MVDSSRKEWLNFPVLLVITSSNKLSIFDSNLDIYNAKAVLQEYTQGLNKDLPEYRLIEEKGKAHNKTFYYEVVYNNEVLSQGEGKTKKDAQQDAAKNACLKLGIIKENNNE